MPRANRNYSAITNRLRVCTETMIRFNFSELEELIGEDRLPPCTYRSKNEWGNSGANAFQRSYTDAGYHIREVNLEERWVIFEKAGSEPQTEAVQETSVENAEETSSEQANEEGADICPTDIQIQAVKFFLTVRLSDIITFNKTPDGKDLPAKIKTDVKKRIVNTDSVAEEIAKFMLKVYRSDNDRKTLIDTVSHKLNDEFSRATEYRIKNSVQNPCKKIIEACIDDISYGLKFANGCTEDIPDIVEYFYKNNAVDAACRESAFAKTKEVGYKFLREDNHYSTDNVNILVVYFEAIKNNILNTDEEHKAIFKQTCQSLCNKVEKNLASDETDERRRAAKKDFMFGNAQKVITIIAKCIYGGACFSLNSSIIENFKYCYCPMDRIMLGAVHDLIYDNNENVGESVVPDEYKERYKNKSKFRGNKDADESYRTCPMDRRTWPYIDFVAGEIPEKYTAYQVFVEAIQNSRNLKNKIEVDYDLWFN